MSATRMQRVTNHRTQEAAPRSVRTGRPSDAMHAPRAAGPSYREEYMHSRAQNIDQWLDDEEYGAEIEHAIKDRARH
jgi:hypothetical protein